MRTIMRALTASILAFLAAGMAHATVWTFDIRFWDGTGVAFSDTSADYNAHFTVDDAWGGGTSNGFWSYAEGDFFAFPFTTAFVDFYYGSAGGGMTIIPYTYSEEDGNDPDYNYMVDMAGSAMITDGDDPHLVAGTYYQLFYGGDESDGQFRITVSENVEAAVPEPAAWAMMLAGFGAIGATLRTRRRTVRFG